MATRMEGKAATATKWMLKGTGYEFCSCNPGCTCNFAGFPSSKSGGCQALVAVVIDQGKCGDVDLSGITACALLDWPKAIHEGNGKAVFVVPPSVKPEQVDALAKIFTGQLGGMPWEILATTYQVAGMERVDIHVNEKGRHSSVSIPGIASATGDTLKNPVTGEDNNVDIVLGTGFIWERGEAGQGTFHAKASGLDHDFKGTSWIHYKYDWSN